jgi:monoamine oxidase
MHETVATDIGSRPGHDDAAYHGWDADPFARGAYSWLPAGALGQQRRLAEPVENTLFFAGEATAAPARNGTVDGAIESGRRAAGEMRTALSVAESGEY